MLTELLNHVFGEILWDLLCFIFALGLLVTVHEWGHFWVARRCGVKVEQFAIGFGPVLLRKTAADGVLYTLGLIPLGGFVKMLDSRNGPVSEAEKPKSFDVQPKWKRAAIIAAGPLCNFIFALLCYWWVFMIGIPAVRPVIGAITPQSIAAKAEIPTNASRQAISDTPTPSWRDVNLTLIKHIGEPQIPITLRTKEGQLLHRTLQTEHWQADLSQQLPIDSLGLIAWQPKPLLIIDQIVADSPAQKSGLKAGDELNRLNDQPITDWQSFTKQLRAHPKQALSLGFLRAGQQQYTEIMPTAHQNAAGETVGFAGIAPRFTPYPKDALFVQQYRLGSAFGYAVKKTGQMLGLTVLMMKKLFTGDLGLETLSGPISIAQGAGSTAQSGWVYFLGFIALISINLGVVNLLPLPMLDGGHLAFLGIEALRGKAVSEKTQAMALRIGAAFLFGLMAVALFNDVMRL